MFAPLAYGESAEVEELLPLSQSTSDQIEGQFSPSSISSETLIQAIQELPTRLRVLERRNQDLEQNLKLEKLQNSQLEKQLEVINKEMETVRNQNQELKDQISRLERAVGLGQGQDGNT